MKALVIPSLSWLHFLPLTCLYGKNELLWVSVQPSEVFSWEKNPRRLPMQITWPWPPVSWPDYCKTKENVNLILIDLCFFYFTQYLPRSPQYIDYKQTWYSPDVRYWWETFTKLFLSNIINHGESDYNNQLVYKVVIWAILGISLWTKKIVLI